MIAELGHFALILALLVALLQGTLPLAGAATWAAEIGRSSRNCAMHSTQATLVARPVRRSAPRRLTSSPL